MKFLLEDLGRRNRKMERGENEANGVDVNRSTTEDYAGIPVGARPLDAAHHSKENDVTHESRWKVAAALKKAGAEHGAWYTPPTKKEKAKAPKRETSPPKVSQTEQTEKASGKRSGRRTKPDPKGQATLDL